MPVGDKQSRKISDHISLKKMGWKIEFKGAKVLFCLWEIPEPRWSIGKAPMLERSEPAVVFLPCLVTGQNEPLRQF
jgi:hypothetical protein